MFLPSCTLDRRLSKTKSSKHHASSQLAKGANSEASVKGIGRNRTISGQRRNRRRTRSRDGRSVRFGPVTIIRYHQAAVNGPDGGKRCSKQGLALDRSTTPKLETCFRYQLCHPAAVNGPDGAKRCSEQGLALDRSTTPTPETYFRYQLCNDTAVRVGCVVIMGPVDPPTGVRFSCNNLPSGLELCEQTGNISGVPKIPRKIQLYSIFAFSKDGSRSVAQVLFDIVYGARAPGTFVCKTSDQVYQSFAGVDESVFRSKNLRRNDSVGARRYLTGNGAVEYNRVSSVFNRCSFHGVGAS